MSAVLTAATVALALAAGIALFGGVARGAASLYADDPSPWPLLGASVALTFLAVLCGVNA